MSRASQRTRRCAGAEQPSKHDCTPALIVDTLADRTARRIYQHVTLPITAGELSTTLDIPGSTTYRKLTELEEAGLIRELEQGPHVDGPAKYVRRIDRVSVTSDDELRIDCRKNGRDVFCKPDL
ncbi:ArsR/SmtB family transcription factor [Natronobacterium gregoryi]|uniref:ArsR family transcriptional regulator n=2 Tax=Natronobacterium gregoryi TaxID=44930 RepID=L0AJ72_NATGS|nr:helix-turn-helix domain-containing protein [Natronobacterium gregoryi]AFZ73856.1 hypothetical protein Natgr_2707 [Natronobacterium gregoryi SP2]ELY65102.1 hypothetical protein C490_14070 [Natronobacterium gregoryi SP2]PLK19689.1 ArsR family transcriptional regulator [Natronobacterium gregoryi SP2]SFJ42597.1 Helix-turn-helix domain-containing protein [Natronobacterium gregoryi]